MADATIQVPDQLIQDMVRGQMVKELSDKPNFVAAIVAGVLNAKPTMYDSYSDRDKTLFTLMFEKMVKSIAQEVFGSWLEEHKDAIKKAICTHLTKHRGRAIQDIANQIVCGMSQYSASVHFALSDK